MARAASCPSKTTLGWPAGGDTASASGGRSFALRPKPSKPPLSEYGALPLRTKGRQQPVAASGSTRRCYQPLGRLTPLAQQRAKVGQRPQVPQLVRVDD